MEDFVMAQILNNDNFNSSIENGVCVVDFFATWCGPCKMLAPVLEDVQEEMKNVKIVKVDIDENPNVASEYKVKNIPTIKVFKNGEEITTNVGFLPKGALVEMINKSI